VKQTFVSNNYIKQTFDCQACPLSLVLGPLQGWGAFAANEQAPGSIKGQGTKDIFVLQLFPKPGTLKEIAPYPPSLPASPPPLTDRGGRVTMKGSPFGLALSQPANLRPWKLNSHGPKEIPFGQAGPRSRHRHPGGPRAGGAPHRDR
jgi:hypothetical protein